MARHFTNERPRRIMSCDHCSLFDGSRGLRCIFFLVLFITLLDLVFNVSVDEYMFFEIIKPSEIAYSYKVRPAKDFGNPLNFSLNEINLVPTDPVDACGAMINIEEIEGNVAMVERGGCSFLSKTIQSERAGARAVIVFDNKEENDDSYIDMVQDETSRETRIPSLFLLGKDGHVILRTLRHHQLDAAIINIPINMTGVLAHKAKLPPWTLW